MYLSELFDSSSKGKSTFLANLAKKTGSQERGEKLVMLMTTRQELTGVQKYYMDLVICIFYVCFKLYMVSVGFQSHSVNLIKISVFVCLFYCNREEEKACQSYGNALMTSYRLHVEMNIFHFS